MATDYQIPQNLVTHPINGIWVRCSNYDQDHMFSRYSYQPDVAWCGRPLVHPMVKLYRTNRTSDSKRCPDCRKKEAEHLARWRITR